jgi:ABC-type glycerol-3-phosphate transport system permease component
MKVSLHRREMRKSIIQYITLFLLSLFSIFPIVSMLSISFSEPTDIFVYPPRMIPSKLTLENYIYAFTSGKMVFYMWNSLIVAGGVTLVTVLAAVPTAYGVARFKFRGRGLATSMVLLCYLLPSVSIAVPLFVVFRTMHLLGSYIAIIIAHITITLPLSVWLMSGYFSYVPWNVEEAAMIDGCSRIGAIYRVVLPMSLPGLVTVIFFSFTASWQEFLYALLFTGSATRTAAIGLVAFIGEEQVWWGALAAGAVVFSIPVIVLYFFVQRYYVATLAGAVKG